MIETRSAATHRPLNMAGVSWIEAGRLATCESSRPGFAVQVIATGEVLSKDGVSPSIWRTKDAAQQISDHAMDWPTIPVHLDR
jgi:hypothetical protein